MKKYLQYQNYSVFEALLVIHKGKKMCLISGNGHFIQKRWLWGSFFRLWKKWSIGTSEYVCGNAAKNEPVLLYISIWQPCPLLLLLLDLLVQKVKNNEGNQGVSTLKIKKKPNQATKSYYVLMDICIFH